MKKYFALTIIGALLLSAVNVQSQKIEFMHSFGGTYMYGFGEDGINGVPALTYAPRLNVYNISRTTTVSVNLNASLGFALSMSTGSYEDNSSMFAYELPVSVDINFGHGATKGARSDFGGYFGLGYGLSSISLSGYSNLIGETGSSLLTHGPYADAGARFKFRGDKSLGLGLYGILGFNSTYIAGLRILYNLGLGR